MTKVMQKTQSEIVLLSLSALSAVTIFPFIFIRLAHGETKVAIFNVIITTVMVVFFTYVHKTRKVKNPSLAMSIFVMLAIIIQILMQGATATYWFYPGMIIVYYLTSEKTAVSICSASMLIVCAEIFPLTNTVEFFVILVTTLLTNIFSFIIFRSYNETQKKLNLLATTDPLTLVGNRRALDQNLSDLIRSQKREEYIMCVILLDLDHFKKVNDNHGHAAGDNILVTVSELIVSNIRVLDTFFRYGGEEFIIVPLKVDIKIAAVMAEKLRSLIEEHQYISDIKVTISLGVAQYRSGESSEEWISRADAALYQAKTSGRNQVCLAD